MSRGFLLPKAAKKAKTAPDDYGFAVNPNLASGYRDIQLELRSLMKGPARKVPAIAEKIKKLQARSDAVIRRLQVPCPSEYGAKQVAEDYYRLMQFIALRDDKIALTEAQMVEEAHVKVRFDVFIASPQLSERFRPFVARSLH